MLKMVKRTITLMATLAIGLSGVKFDTRIEAKAAKDEPVTATLYGDTNLDGKI